MSSRRIVSYEDWRAAGFFPALDGLRAVAALMVVFHHARTHWLWGWLEGWNGVTLFFVLSGFLITTLALREEETLGALRWRAFVVRRVFRIVPIYVVSLALYVLAMVAVGVGASHRGSFVHAMPWYVSPFPEVPFFTHTHIVFSLAWSLGIEEKFYLLWPLAGLRAAAGARTRAPGPGTGARAAVPAPDRLQLRRACARAVHGDPGRLRARLPDAEPLQLQARQPARLAALVLRVPRPARRRAGRSRTSSTRRLPASASPRPTTTSRIRSRPLCSSRHSCCAPRAAVRSSPPRCG